MNVMEKRTSSKGFREKKDHEHPNPKIRMAAVEKLDDPDVLVEIACTDDSPRVRVTAVLRLKDDQHLEKIARDGEHLDARLIAVERVFSQGVLADLLRSPENLELIGMCFSRITDRRIIESIAEDPAYSPAVRRMAVEYYADESFLEDAAKEAAEPERKSEEAVEAFVEAYGGGLRGVRAIGRFRRSEKALKALGTIARKGGETGGLAVEYLCSALGSSNPSLVECAQAELEALRDPDLVDCIIRSLDKENLRQPIRKVLATIGTPEAKAALGATAMEH